MGVIITINNFSVGIFEFHQDVGSTSFIATALRQGRTPMGVCVYPEHGGRCYFGKVKRRQSNTCVCWSIEPDTSVERQRVDLPAPDPYHLH
mmetsp:Transcript_13766/g.26695  ORF Transcript_13766/g.26695 Transcript_13766/m.26695 type:complete len:91 (+) Transcript_13766:238-510(+)